MSKITMKNLQKQRNIYHKNNQINHGKEKQPTKKIKVKLQYDLLWNKFVQAFPQIILGLLNIPTLTWY